MRSAAGDIRRTLLNGDQLVAYLAERGIALPSLSGIPVSGRHGTVPRYNGRDVLEWAEAEPD